MFILIFFLEQLAVQNDFYITNVLYVYSRFSLVNLFISLFGRTNCQWWMLGNTYADVGQCEGLSSATWPEDNGQ